MSVRHRLSAATDNPYAVDYHARQWRRNGLSRARAVMIKALDDGDADMVRAAAMAQREIREGFDAIKTDTPTP